MTKHSRHSLYIPTLLLLGSRNSKENVCPKPGTLISTPSGGSVILLVRLYTSLGRRGRKTMKKPWNMFYCHMTTSITLGLTFWVQYKNFKCCYSEGGKNPTQADMIRVLSWLRDYTVQTITLIPSMIYGAESKIFCLCKTEHMDVWLNFIFKISATLYNSTSFDFASSYKMERLIKSTGMWQ